MNLKDRSAQDRYFDELAELIDSCESVCICAHTGPDGDAIGSQLALAQIIRQNWPAIQVTSLLADNREIPRSYRFLPYAATLVRPEDYSDTPDLFICVDLSEPTRLADSLSIMERAKSVAVMDHHPCQNPYGKVFYTRPDAAAVGVIVTEFAQHLHVALTPQIAQCLMCAVVTDTGRFQYQNADGEALVIASTLVEAGASPSEISLNVYQSSSLGYLHLLACVMGRITTFSHGRIASSYATRADFERTGARLDECDGLIDSVRVVDGAQVAVFIKEVEPGVVRGNLRSKLGHDISGVARQLGGGGHAAAAGFTFEGTVDEALQTVIPLLVQVLDEGCPQR